MEIPNSVKETAADLLETAVKDVLKGDSAAEVVADVTDAFIGKVPALWNLQPHEEGVEAHNSTTGERFVGAIELFNKRLRG